MQETCFHNDGKIMNEVDLNRPPGCRGLLPGPRDVTLVSMARPYRVLALGYFCFILCNAVRLLSPVGIMFSTMI